MLVTNPPLVKYLIGEGSFGRVYKFKYENNTYAIKKVYLKPGSNLEQIFHMFQEIRLMKIMSKYRNFLVLHGQKIQEDKLHIVTQYIPDGDLRCINFIPKQNDIWEVVMQLAMALDQLKENKIIHRDIKPENILIHRIQSGTQATETVLKVMDFGLSVDMSQSQYATGTVGSPIYFAPQLCQYKKYSYQVDIWSLGITLYQLLNYQKSPYHDQLQQFIISNPEAGATRQIKFIMGLILKKKIKCNSPYHQINRLIQRMLSHDPKHRPTPHQILKHQKVIEKLKNYSKNKINNLFQQLSIFGRRQYFRQKNINEQTKKMIRRRKENSPTYRKPNRRLQQIEDSEYLGYSQSEQVSIFSNLSSRMSDTLIKNLEQQIDGEMYPIHREGIEFKQGVSEQFQFDIIMADMRKYKNQQIK